MKLHVYDHCPFCVRPRLVAGLKGIDLPLSIIMEGDVETPTRMVGKKMVPILQKDDGSFMGESLDIVHYLDQLGTPAFDGEPDAALDAWAQDAWKPSLRLVIPRFTKADFAELATPEARAAYLARETKAFGDLDALMAATPDYIAEMKPKLEALVPLVDGRDTYTISDITLWPLLRCMSIVKDLPFPAPVRAYMERLSTAGKVDLLFDKAL